MKSLTKSLTMLPLLIMMMPALTMTFDHGDHVCMVCPCDPQRCIYTNSHICCKIFDTTPLARLTVSVNCSRPGRSHVIDDPAVSVNDSSSCSGFHIIHENSCLTAFPDNYCDLALTRAISMANNSLSEFPDLGCLPHLGRLDLRHNKLTHVPHEAFRGLKYIREVFLDHNHITHIHPLAFEEDLLELSRFSISFNRLLIVDAKWLLNMQYSFCYFNFSHNFLQDFTSHDHWKVNMSIDVNYGPGYVDFSYNHIEYGPLKELRKIGIKSDLQLAKFINWGFDFRHNPLRCDCNMYEAAKWVKVFAKFIWRDYFNATCYNPSIFRGVPVIQLPLDVFVCNVTGHCPSACLCQKQPEAEATNIFCGNVGLRSLPVTLPEANHLAIYMANNSLDSLPPRQYLTRTKMIDLRGSGLKEIEKDTPHLLRKAELVDLRDNEFHHLPSTFQVLDPEIVRLDLRTLICSCDLIWMSAWLHHTVSHGLKNIACQKENGDWILLIEATKDELCDDKPRPTHHTAFQISLIGFLCFVAVTVSMMVKYRYEVKVMVQKYRTQHSQHQRQENLALLNAHRFDVLIIVNVNSDSDTQWVNSVLIPQLDLRGLTSYLPLRDCPAGSVEMDEIIKRMKESATALVVLSPDFIQSPSCLSQFRNAYNHMVVCKQGRLLIIRRNGQLSRQIVPDPHLRAMVTLRMFHSSDPEQLVKALDTLIVDQETEL